MVLFILDTLWFLSETSEEEEGVVEEPETFTQEQARFNWAPSLDGGGGSLVLAESESQRLLAQVFSFEPLSLSFSLVLIPLPLPMVTFRLPYLLLVFFQGLCIKQVFCSGSWNAWRPRASNK